MPVLEATGPTQLQYSGSEERVQDAYLDDLPDNGIREALERLSELELPAEDGIPLESNWHRIEINLLIDSIHHHWRGRTNYFAGGNMFIYFNINQARNRDYRGPDMFVVKEVDGTRDRDSWVLWKEDGRYPDVIVELSSPSTMVIDTGMKKVIYEKTFRTQEYFCYDPKSKILYGWKLVGRHYQKIEPNERNWLWSEELGLWLGAWEGSYLRVDTEWLRFYTNDEQLVPTLAEAEAQRVETEAQRADNAEAEVERLRALLQQYQPGKPEGK